MKKTIVIVALLMLMLSTGVFAETKLNVTIDGASEAGLGNPVLINGRTMLPARAILERFGFEMIWDAETRTVVGKRDDYTITMTIDSSQAKIQNKEQFLDQPSTIVDGRTYVPVRFISDAVGTNISYDAHTLTVNIDTSALRKQFRVADPVLNTYLAKKSGKELYTVGDFYYMTQLSLPSMGIYSLDGIENIVNLKMIDFSANEISDLTPLSKLKQLNRLAIAENQVVNLTPISGMRTLEYLDVRKNKISDFYPLASMSWIKDLYITGNATQNYTHLYYNKGNYRNLDVELSRIEQPLYDTPVLNSYRSYEVSVGDDILWVSAMRSGAPDISNEDIERILRVSPNSINQNIDSVYSSLQVIQLLGDVKKNGNLETIIPVPERHFDWHVQPSASQIVEKRSASSHGLASLVGWMLQGDYLESGILMAVKTDGSVQSYNYARIDRRETYELEHFNGPNTIEARYIPEYYVFSAEAYIRRGKAVQENGVFEDFQTASALEAGVIKTGSLEKYASNLKKFYPDVKSIVSVRHTSGTDPFVPYGVSKSAERILYLPLEYQAYCKVLLGESELLQFHKYK